MSRQKHDWLKEDCYHHLPPYGYCGYEKYICRNCWKTYECAQILPPNDIYCASAERTEP